jgi:phospholipase/carboxylesterase
MQPRILTAKAGPLTVRVVDVEEGGKPKALVVLCHGYGAPGTDLVGIAGEVLAMQPHLAKEVRFAFPEAPLALEDAPFGGRAWWHIDIGRFQRAAMTGSYAELLEETPDGLPAARRALHATVDELVRQSGVPWSRVLLGGFSQGAMVSTDLTLRLEEAPGALAVLSGTLLSRSEWARLAEKRRGLHVLQSHGTQDPILPYPAALELKSVFEAAGLSVDFTSFRGGHGIDGDVIDKLADLVAKVAL